MLLTKKTKKVCLSFLPISLIILIGKLPSISNKHLFLFLIPNTLHDTLHEPNNAHGRKKHKQSLNYDIVILQLEQILIKQMLQIESKKLRDMQIYSLCYCYKYVENVSAIVLCS